jgi:hypothetical protein
MRGEIREGIQFLFGDGRCREWRLEIRGWGI